MKHTIDLGTERLSGRTTIMLATLVGLGETGSLYVAFSGPHAARARGMSRHRVRCISAEAFVRDIGYWLSSVEHLALDDLDLWPRYMHDEALHVAERDGRLKLLMLAH
jgi:hypothetical protein